VLILEEGNVSIKQFDDSEHPYHLPDRIDIFTWSMPFLIEKVVQMMKSVYTKWQDEDDENVEEGYKKMSESGKLLYHKYYKYILNFLINFLFSAKRKSCRNGC